MSTGKEASGKSRHPDFASVEASRPTADKGKSFEYTQTFSPDWKVGSGATDNEWQKHKKIEIDPYGEGRQPVDNYKTLISGIVARPIGFISTVSKDGVRNLAPFSYFNAVNHDPPMFAVGFSGGTGNAKDTARNILDTKELTINIISEWFIEAANFTCTAAPSSVDEWKLSGLTPLASVKVKPQHVAESAFSIEAKLVHVHEWTSRADPTKSTGTTFIVEGINFHVREDVINEDRNNIDIAKLKPVVRLGGISYARVLDGFELPRPDFEKEVLGDEDARKLAD